MGLISDFFDDSEFDDDSDIDIWDDDDDDDNDDGYKHDWDDIRELSPIGFPWITIPLWMYAQKERRTKEGDEEGDEG